MNKFSSKINIEEFVSLLKLIKNKSYDLKKAITDYEENGRYYYNINSTKPNFCAGNKTYTLTDDAIIYSWPFECDGEGAYGWQVNAGSSPMLEKEVKMFYLHKFGQEYLDYLLGPNVAILNPEFTLSSSSEEKMKEKSLEKRNK